MNTNTVTYTRTTSRLFAYSRWDMIPVLAAGLQGAYLVSLFFLFPRLPWWALGLLGAIYSVSISWNLNGIAHNFIHNPYFCSPRFNRLFSTFESLVLGSSQTLYDCVHKRHHQGNSDRPDETGETIDWLSIYRHSKDGEAESVWAYTFLGYFRDDVRQTYRVLKARSRVDAQWGVFEIGLVLSLYLSILILNWRFMVYFLPFYYLGHSLSNLNGYYRHYGANPDVPIAWGVSNYGFLYNLIWFNNGYHAEHHYRPRIHWTKMSVLHKQIREDMKAAGVRVISTPHALGFLDRTLPRRRKVALRGQPA